MQYYWTEERSYSACLFSLVYKLVYNRIDLPNNEPLNQPLPSFQNEYFVLEADLLSTSQIAADTVAYPNTASELNSPHVLAPEGRGQYHA